MKSLFDPWSRGKRIPLNRPLERWDVYPLLTAFCALIAGFILFQGLGLLISAGLLAAQGVGITEVAEMSTTFLADNLGLFLLSNSIAQVIGLGLLAVALTWLHTSSAGSFLRLRGTDAQVMFWSIIGLVVLLPIVWWLGQINELLPVPDFWSQFEDGREELTQAIVSGHVSIYWIIAGVAVVPAICEELIFRGYAQRQLERSLGVVGGIVLCGMLFGMFHLTLLQLLPLTVLGIYLAYLTWRTGSLWPAIVAHFANNTIAILAAQASGDISETQLRTLETVELSWYIVLLSLIFFVGVVYALENRVRAVHPTDSNAEVTEHD